MSDKKVSQLQELVSPKASDLLLVIDMSSEIPVSKHITIGSLTGNLPVIAIANAISANTSAVNVTVPLNANSVTLNSLVIAAPATPVDSSDSQFKKGNFFYDQNYLYIKVSNTEIKRVSLQTF